MGAVPVELVVTDLDGTLWRREGELEPATAAALAALERRDVPVLAATGRRLRSARLSLAKVGLDHLPLIALNGALGADRAGVFHSARFTKRAAAEVYAAFVTHGVRPVGYTIPNGDLECFDSVAEPGVSTHPDHLAVLAPTLVTGDVLANDLVAMSVLGVPHAVLAPIKAAVTAAGHGDCALSRDHAYGEHNLAITARGVSKWTGVLAYCARRGIDPSRVLAVGNDDNDVAMLTNAAVGLAMPDCEAHVVASSSSTITAWADLVDYV